MSHRLKEVNTLSTLALEILVKALHHSLAICSRKARIQIRTRIFSYVEKIAKTIPASLYPAFFENITEIVTSEKKILNEAFYEGLSHILNRNTKSLRLGRPKFFQDSSMAMEAFLSNLEEANLQKLELFKSVTDLICFDVEDLLTKIAANFSNLAILTLQGLNQTENPVDNATLLLFLEELRDNCSSSLTHLDLSDSNTDEDCAEVIGDFRNLKVLKLNHTLVDTESAADLLKKCPNLVRFDCLSGSENRVQNAIMSLEGGQQQTTTTFFRNLRYLIFRQPKGFQIVAESCPEIEKVRVCYYLYETGYETDMDAQLHELSNFDNIDIELDFNSINTLFLIQMDNLQSYGYMITKVILTEATFVNPVTMNPLGAHCVNLRSLIIIHPTIVEDDMFVGELPPMAEQPFRKLEEFSFEGEELSLQIGTYFLRHCLDIKEIRIRVSDYLAPVVSDILSDYPRRSLNFLSLSFKKWKEENCFGNSLLKVIESCDNLQNVEISTTERNVSKTDLEEITEIIRSFNWDVKLNYVIINSKPRI